MIRKKLWYKIIVIISLLIFCNLVYYFATSWQEIFPKATSVQKISYKNYNNSKLGIELTYPETWVLQDSGKEIDINPLSSGGTIYFSAALRDDFKSLDDIKKTLAADVPVTAVQVSGATGLEYTDSDYHKIIWLQHSSNIYLFKTYFSPSSYDRTADKILATIKFSD